MTGSLINNLYERATIGQPQPEVGMGMTKLMYSDRSPYTIVKVLSPHRIVVTADIYERIDKNGMSDSQEYNYTTNWDGTQDILRLNKRGQWKLEGDPTGSTYAIGQRERYFDYSF
jgi:hypothetical protein